MNKTSTKPKNTFIRKDNKDKQLFSLSPQVKKSNTIHKYWNTIPNTIYYM